MASHHRASTGRPDHGHLQGWKGRPDPMEVEVAEMLTRAGEDFDRHHPARLDFYLPRLDLFIECKRFHTPRIAEQLARVPDRDVIVLQGAGALAKLRILLAQ